MPLCLCVFFLAFHFRRKFKSEETKGVLLEYPRNNDCITRRLAFAVQNLIRTSSLVKKLNLRVML